MKAFVLTISSANGILTDSIANVEIEYTTQNEVSIQEGDHMIGFVAQPIGQVRMIFEASKDSEGNKIYLRKLIDVSEGVHISEIADVQIAVDTAESEGKDIIEIAVDSFENVKEMLLKRIGAGTKENSISLKEEFRRYILYVLGLISTRQVRDLEMVSEMAIEDGAIEKPVYMIDDVEEYRETVNKIRECNKYKEYKAIRKSKNGESGLACDQGMTNYEKFLLFYNTEDEDKYIPINPCTGYKSSQPRNRIFFGAPGTGKSFTVNQERKTLLGEENEVDYERVTFHPDYSYANFVGTYKPVPCKDSEGKDSITYEYVPGPFMRVLVKALRSARLGEKKPYLLIVEEINRANVAAVFGDVFQLLDRNEKNVSEYTIQASEDIKNYLAKPEVLGGVPEQYARLCIPDNMFIWSTMNSADQGVFPMDTAFKRRWDFTYIGIDDNDMDLVGKTVVLGTKVSQKVEWNKLRKAINNYLAKQKINEDKQLGPYFIARDIVVPENGIEIDKDRFAKVFKSKVIMYLFEDAAKQKRHSLFEGCFEGSSRYSEICKQFDEKGIGIFNSQIQLETAPEDLSEAASGMVTAD